MLGNQRRPDESCAPDPAALDPGPPDREVRHAAGTTTVRADPQRIVVLSGDQLDALCALGLQSRIVAAALPDGSDQASRRISAPSCTTFPASARRSEPDMQAIKAANPDLILGSQALTPDAYPRADRDRPDGVHRSRPARSGRTTCARSARRPDGSTPPTA